MVSELELKELIGKVLKEMSAEGQVKASAPAEAKKTSETSSASPTLASFAKNGVPTEIP